MHQQPTNVQTLYLYLFTTLQFKTRWHLYENSVCIPVIVYFRLYEQLGLVMLQLLQKNENYLCLLISYDVQEESLNLHNVRQLPHTHKCTSLQIFKCEFHTMAFLERTDIQIIKTTFMNFQ